MSTWMQVHTHGEGVIVAMDSQWALFVRTDVHVSEHKGSLVYGVKRSMQQHR